ncbi:MAG TPA: transglycosylase SLT domain-containing protein [Dongiaceae bacterium]|jgi:hypothetical protein|nr:transglycosylase SLT domain-containing protein [Dongiaceae bacterium]
MDIAPAGIAPPLINSVATAARSTKVDFAFLMAQAAQESNFDPNAKAAGSSARGLYQFINQTWLGVFRQHGAEVGQGALAAQIMVDARGQYHVADAVTRAQILGLRNDPKISAYFAAAHAADNREALAQNLEREVRPADLYIAHLLGIGGAQKFLAALRTDGGQAAARLFPRAAESNAGIFYASDGKEKSLAQVYAALSVHLDQDMVRYAALDPQKAQPATAPDFRIAQARTPAPTPGLTGRQLMMLHGKTSVTLPLSIALAPYRVI